MAKAGVMIKKPARKALGRGLSALISAKAVPVTPPAKKLKAQEKAAHPERGKKEAAAGPTVLKADGQSVHYLKIEQLINNPHQPRQEFKEQELRELSESIKSLGLLQPVLVRPAPGEAGRFEIVAGERRWRAAKLAGLAQVPVTIKDLNELQALEVALVENVQRQDLNPVEEARAYQRLAEEFSLSQKEIAEQVGKERATVANFMRLLNLPEPVLEMLSKEKLSMGHAKALLTIREPSAQLSLARKVEKENLSVRALETIVSRVVVLDAGKCQQRRLSARLSGSPLSDSLPEISDRLRKALGTKVTVRHLPSGRGKIEIEYFSEQELDRLIEIMCAERQRLIPPFPLLPAGDGEQLP